MLQHPFLYPMDTPLSTSSDRPSDAPLLQVDNLSVSFLRDDTFAEVTHQISFALQRGRTLGIVGESGSGKSVSCMALMQLLSASQTRVSGTARFYPSDGTPVVDLLQLDERQMCAFRGRRLAMVFQEPMTSLNPVMRCGEQVVEMLQQHERVSHDAARRRVVSLFEEVSLPRPEKIFESYPHEISGGQKQRVMIAMALVCHPDILIADEPTTALDVTVQRDILLLLRQLQQKYRIGIIFITHDLGVVAQVADEVLVMYQGRAVEQGLAADVLYHPQHPYTRGLIACRPPVDHRPLRLPTVDDFMRHTEQHVPEGAPDRPVVPDSSRRPILSAQHLSVSYPLKKNFFGKTVAELHAVDDVSFDIYEGETLGLVGESGCGKSTLARALLRLEPLSAGCVRFDGIDVTTLKATALRRLRERMQIVFQDPYSSLNPHLTVGDTLAEPMITHHTYGSVAECRRQVARLLSQVGLPASSVNRYPHEFSGGQRQRIVIARALALNPQLVVCDESVSALDVSVQAQVLNLLNDLKREYGYTYLFITHDLSVVKFLSDRILVMRQGRIVEQGPVDSLYANPQTDYTRQLLEAIPRL